LFKNWEQPSHFYEDEDRDCTHKLKRILMSFDNGLVGIQLVLESAGVEIKTPWHGSNSTEDIVEFNAEDGIKSIELSPRDRLLRRSVVNNWAS